jgi:ssDNA-binding Zn-finger/Zn-ribbon topoisomerase 1
MKIEETGYKCPLCAGKLYAFDGIVRCIKCSYEENRNGEAKK